jgi:hypothetical protein
VFLVEVLRDHELFNFAHSGIVSFVSKRFLTIISLDVYTCDVAFEKLIVPLVGFMVFSFVFTVSTLYCNFILLDMQLIGLSCNNQTITMLLIVIHQNLNEE